MIGDDLLQVAQALAQRQLGKLRQGYLRRSISSCYYAVFHSLAQLCADHLVGAISDGRTHGGGPIARWSMALRGTP